MRHTPAKLLLAFAILLITLPAFGAETRGVKRVEIKTSSGETVGLYEESHALVIGVSDYTNGWPKLPGVRKDVKAVTAALETHGFNVEVVEDAKDYDALDDAFTGFIRRHGRKAENRLLFYFAGHGHTVKNYGEEMGYIIPTASPNPNRDLDGFLDSAMDMRQIEVYAQRIRSKHALFLFDSCFSGSLFALSRAVPENISYKTAKPVRQFIMSGSAEEQVPDTSIFRQQFVAALRGEGDTDGDRYVTAIELGEFLQKTVVNYSRNAQHPQYGKIRNPNLDKGDFVFALPKAQEVSPETVTLPKQQGDFSLDDLDEEARQEERARLAWDNRLEEMRNAVEQVRGYERHKISPSTKVKAFRRFLTAFTNDNPYTEENERLRSEAQDRTSHWKGEQDRVLEEQRKPAHKILEPEAFVLPIYFVDIKDKNTQRILWQHTLKELSQSFELRTEKEVKAAKEMASDKLPSKNCTTVACIRVMRELLDVDYTFALAIANLTKEYWLIAALRMDQLGKPVRKRIGCSDCNLTKARVALTTLIKVLLPVVTNPV